jgi:hypothetical protein
MVWVQGVDFEAWRAQYNVTVNTTLALTFRMFCTSDQYARLKEDFTVQVNQNDEFPTRFANTSLSFSRSLSQLKAGTRLFLLEPVDEDALWSRFAFVSAVRLSPDDGLLSYAIDGDVTVARDWQEADVPASKVKVYTLTAQDETTLTITLTFVPDATNSFNATTNSTVPPNTTPPADPPDPHDDDALLIGKSTTEDVAVISSLAFLALLVANGVFCWVYRRRSNNDQQQQQQQQALDEARSQGPGAGSMLNVKQQGTMDPEPSSLSSSIDTLSASEVSTAISASEVPEGGASESVPVAVSSQSS